MWLPFCDSIFFLVSMFCFNCQNEACYESLKPLYSLSHSTCLCLVAPVNLFLFLFDQPALLHSISHFPTVFLAILSIPHQSNQPSCLSIRPNAATCLSPIQKRFVRNTKDSQSSSSSSLNVTKKAHSGKLFPAKFFSFFAVWAKSWKTSRPLN